MIKKIMIISVIGAILCSSLTACGGNSKNKTQQQEGMQGTGQGEKIPPQLKSLEDNIEKIIYTLKGPAVAPKEDQGKGNNNSNDKGKSGQGSQSSQQASGQQGGSQGQGGDQQNQGTQQSQGTQQPQQQEKPEDPWETISPLINDMHYKWNSYMPMAAKRGAGKELLDSFGNSLNSLTNTIISKNSTNTLLAASMLYSNIPDFYSLYRTSTSPEVKRMRYYTRNAMLNAFTANWTQATTDMNNLKALWSLFKNTATKENQDNFNKLDFSIYELGNAINDRNQPITAIKGSVAMSNIEALEKSMSKESGGNQSEDQSSGSGSGESSS